MVRTGLLAPFLLTLLAILVPAVLPAQARFEIAPPPTSNEWASRQYESPSSVALENGRFASSWVVYSDHTDFHAEDTSSVLGCLIPAGPEPWFRGGWTGNYIDEKLFLRPAPDGGFAGVWLSGGAWADLFLRTWGPDAVERIEAVMVNEYEDYEAIYGRTLAVAPSGRMAVAWMGIAEGITPLLRIVAPSGEMITPELPVGPSFLAGSSLLIEETSSPQIGLDAAGRLLVVWAEPGPAGGAPLQWWGRHFDLDGAALDERFAVEPGGRGNLFLTVQPGGGFTAFWPAPLGLGIPPDLHLLRRFSPDGSPLGPALVAGGVKPFAPELAADRHGNLAVLGIAEGRAVVRLWNSWLVPQGDPIELDLLPESADFSIALALADDGRILASWVDGRKPPEERSVLGTLVQARHDADLCIYRGRRVLCDTAGDGGTGDVKFGFGLGRPTDLPLLGDVDGNGRADVCLFRSGRFLCDTAQDGGRADLQVGFGQPGDTPLLADLDGNGRSDPCVRRGRNLLCDLAHDGGAAELTIKLGNVPDPVVAGDVDGDSRDELCLYRNGRFFCDTEGSGDFTRLLNLRQVAHRLPGAVPLLGDVDGDGRADPCLYESGRLVCGIFTETGQSPARWIERAFGRTGDAPLLGDLDAF
ncbi:MAG TPA: hypothetical protein VLQ45_35200 [Thermoanaerobaculia bacterium]|nr:hypothetical protein [Thermoanaerobaculia bacterium]